MKVRLHEDSVRIRLTQAEVVRLGSGETLMSATHFGKGSIQIEIDPDGFGFAAVFEESRIRVRVPKQAAKDWSLDDREGLYATDGPCGIALEKDYACLHKTGDQNAGTFPNPSAL